MDTNINNIELEKGKEILLKIAEPNKVLKCSKCGCRRAEGEFLRNGKTFKTCNVCENLRTAKLNKPVKNIVKEEIKEVKVVKMEPAGKITDKALNDLLNDKNIDNVDKKPAVDNFLDKLLNDNLIELKKINEMEMYLHMSLTSENDYSLKTPQEKTNYQRTIIELFTKKLQSTNPLVFMLLMGAGIVEKNTHYLSYAGLDLDLEGYQKELDTHRKELNDCCNDILIDAPEIVKWLNNPYLKLTIILTHAGHEVHKKNMDKKQLGSSKSY